MKKRLGLIALVCCIGALCCFVLSGCNDQGKYVGTWYLQYNEVANQDKSEDATAAAVIYTAEDMEAFRSVDLDFFLNIKSDNTAALDELDLITEGKWNVTGSGASITFEDLPDTPCPVKLEGDTLTMERAGAKYYFKKGDTKDPLEQPKEEEQELVMADENGMSITFDSSEKLDKEIVIADDDTIKLVIDGKGVTPVGDPGFNVQVENKSDKDVNVWVKDPFTVGDKNVMVYTYQPVKAGKSTTVVLQFDMDDLGAKTTDALKDVKGQILVEDADGNNIGTYEVEVA